MRFKLVRLFGLLTSILAASIAIQIVLMALQRNSAETTETSIKGLFRSSSAVTDSLELNRQIDDLEMLGLLRCATIGKRGDEGPLYVDNRQKYLDCFPSAWQLRGVSRSVDIKTLNGSVFHVSFLSTPQSWFYISLWLARMFAIFVTTVSLLSYWFRLDQKNSALMKEEENNRILEERVRTQAQQLADMKVHLAVQESLASLAAQVSHDIRSPLSALTLVAKSITELPADKRLLIQNASIRINQIANDLLSRYRSSHLPPHQLAQATVELRPVVLSEFLVRIVSEKQAAFSETPNLHFRTDFNTPGEAICNIDEKELARAISNLINNAAEALHQKDGGEITLALRSSGQNEVAIVIADNGMGMPDHVLAKLGRERVTEGKDGTQSGSGIGVLHAARVVEEMNGKFQIQSKLAFGTIITMRFARIDQSSISPASVH